MSTQFDIHNLVRENIRQMRPYSTARHEYSGQAGIFLDANENPFGSPLPFAHNRYPDPQQTLLKEKISRIKGVLPENMFLGNGSDEAIDLLYRIVCEPGKDNVIICPPTYGMYEVCAAMNNIEVRSVPLQPDFQLDLPSIAAAANKQSRILFVCSPNNPTGNCLNRQDVEWLLNNFQGLVVVDEAYINFARQRSLISELTEYPNLVILQTFSKAWGLAGLRLGMAFAAAAIIGYLNKVKYPYNVNTATQQLALQALDNLEQVNSQTRQTVAERERLTALLGQLPFVKKVFSSEANFLLLRVQDAPALYRFLSGRGIIVRDRSQIIHCDNCLRISVGTPEENATLIQSLHEYQ